jgi:hypothetical protein
MFGLARGKYANTWLTYLAAVSLLVILSQCKAVEIFSDISLQRHSRSIIYHQFQGVDRQFFSFFVFGNERVTECPMQDYFFVFVLNECMAVLV